MAKESSRGGRTLYLKGRSFEHRCREQLQSYGYFVIRAAGSKTPADLVCLAGGTVLLVQCKTSGRLAPDDWNYFYDLALSIGAVPVLASRIKYYETEYTQLTGRKDGTRRRQPMKLIDPKALLDGKPIWSHK